MKEQHEHMGTEDRLVGSLWVEIRGQASKSNTVMGLLQITRLG